MINILYIVKSRTLPEGGPLFTTVTIAYKVAVCAPAEWADTLTLFHLYQYMYSVGLKHASLRSLGGRGMKHGVWHQPGLIFPS
jgi:hypothetical protein